MFFSKFLKDETGAVTVDWVVMTAAVTGLGVAALGTVGSGILDLSTDVSGTLASSKIVRSAFIPTIIRNFTQGTTGELLTSNGPVGYTITQSNGVNYENGTLVTGNVGGNYANDQGFTVAFDKTNTDGLRLNLALMTQNHGGPVLANFKINGEYPDLQAMLANGEITTNLKPNALHSGYWQGPFSRAELRGLPDNAYIDFHTDMDSFEVTGDAQSNMPDVEIILGAGAVGG